MNLPFTIEQFLEVFVRYNTLIWPIQIGLYALALVGIWLLFSRKPVASRWIILLLAGLWAWTGVVYQWISFTAINPAAYLFGLFFVIQAGLFLWAGFGRDSLRFGDVSRPRTLVAAMLIGYALVVYPLLGLAFGHVYPASPTFGAPCPTTIFTFGMFFLLREPFPRYILVIPLAWAAVGGSAALILGVPEDYGLVVAGLAGLVLALLKFRPHRVAAAH